MAQQTAVEWFVNSVFGKNGLIIYSEIIEQAKAMEKEQIKDAYWNGTTDMEKQDALLEAEDFFNDYYKK